MLALFRKRFVKSPSCNLSDVQPLRIGFFIIGGIGTGAQPRARYPRAASITDDRFTPSFVECPFSRSNVLSRRNIDQFGICFLEVHGGKEIPRGVGQVVLVVVARHPQIDVPHSVVDERGSGHAQLPIALAVSRGTFGVGFSQATQADRRDQVVSFRLGIAGSLRSRWELDDVGHGLTFSWTTAATDDAVSAIRAFAFVVLAQVEIGEIGRGHVKTLDLGMLKPQSCRVLIDFDLHLCLRDLKDEHQAPPLRAKT